MLHNRRLILAHFWLAFGGFGLAVLLGAWQMYIRSPLHAWLGQPELYYRSVTAHGTTMGYVFPTLVAMGFGYAITEAKVKVGGKLRSNATLTFSHIPFPNPDLRVHMDAVAKRVGFPLQAIA